MQKYGTPTRRKGPQSTQPQPRIKLVRTPQTEASRKELRQAMPTLASVQRLILAINGGTLPRVDGPGVIIVEPNPGRLGPSFWRHKPGWVWECGRCRRESDGEASEKPGRCPFCKAHQRMMEGRESTVYYPAEHGRGGGGTYDGGIEALDMVLSFAWWLKAAADHREDVYGAVDGWILGRSLRETAAEVRRSREWVRTAVESVRQEWERD